MAENSPAYNRQQSCNLTGFVARIKSKHKQSFVLESSSDNRIGVRHSELEHLVENRAFNEDFGLLLRHIARVKPIPEDRLIAEHEGFDQGTDMVAHILFPPLTRGSPDRPEVFVPGVRRGMGIAVRPDLGVLLRRYQYS